MNEVTLEKISEFGDVSEAINWAQKELPNYPKGMKKPLLIGNRHPTIEETKKYLSELEEYNMIQEDYKKLTEDYWNAVGEINNVINLFIRKESGLNTIPEQYRDKVYSIAYQDGHSDGYYEVYLHLCKLINIFK